MSAAGLCRAALLAEPSPGASGLCRKPGVLPGEHSRTPKAPWTQNGGFPPPLLSFQAVSEGVWGCREAPLLCPLA